LIPARVFAAAVVVGAAVAACSSSGEGSNAGANGDAAVCGGLTGSVLSSKDFAPDCRGLSDADTLDCIEKRFWIVLREDYDARPAVYALIGDIIERTRGEADPKDVANLYFRRGQLAMAIALEQKDQTKIFTVMPDFDEALALYPEHPVIPTWKDTLEIAFAAIVKDHVKLAEAFDKALANVPACPLGNIPSLTGTTIGVPLSTGIPQKTIELAETWKCEGVEWCEANTWKAPYAAAGMRYHFAEAYVRMGMKERAVSYLDAARAAPDYDRWPMKPFVEDKIENLDAFIGTFTSLAPEESAFDKVYANSDKGCVFCHGVR
jgi:hypothetical protein